MDPGIDLCDEDVYKPPSAREARPKSQRSRIALGLSRCRIFATLHQVGQSANVSLPPLDPGPIPLGLSEVDDILRLIDAFTANTSPGSGRTGDSLLLTCFGVFKGTADRHEEFLAVPEPDRGLCDESDDNLSTLDSLNEQEPCFTGNSHNDLHWSLDQDANSRGGSVALESETDQDKTSLAHAQQF